MEETIFFKINSREVRLANVLNLMEFYSVKIQTHFICLLLKMLYKLWIIFQGVQHFLTVNIKTIKHLKEVMIGKTSPAPHFQQNTSKCQKQVSQLTTGILQAHNNHCPGSLTAQHPAWQKGNHIIPEYFPSLQHVVLEVFLSQSLCCCSSTS